MTHRGWITLLLLLPLAAGTARACVPYAPNSSVTWNTHTGGCTFPVLCPQGDAPGTIDLTVRDFENFPLPGIPQSQVIAGGACTLLGGTPCVQVTSVAANAPTDQNGFTTITVARAAGCCTALPTSAAGTQLATLPYRSYDLSGDGVVDLSDLGILATSFQLTKGQAQYNECCDYNCDDAVTLSDLGFFASHFNHRCS